MAMRWNHTPFSGHQYAWCDWLAMSKLVEEKRIVQEDPGGQVYDCFESKGEGECINGRRKPLNV
jgi:hypothetical protein